MDRVYGAMISAQMLEHRTPPSIDEHVALLISERVVKRVAERTGGDMEATAALLNTYAAECKYGHHLITKQLPPGCRILEVGAGIGMLSSYLQMLGHDITALEPCAAGFDFFAIQEVVSEETKTDVPFLHVRAEELTPLQHGVFQFIFSVNVLEHIPDLAGALAGMVSVLAPGGRMWHTCPNYVLPYEPHFGLPLIPMFPRATSILLPRRISSGEVWRSLNFITYFGLKRLARANGLTTTFRTGTMAEALRRLDSDREFAARQSGLPSLIYRILSAVGGVSAIEALPAAVSTPMMVAMENGDPAP
jgi:2-polyprenyl-3-methyl-5-hydroxy-6-metoxy-1,4-benzoquinol methylase